jgi:uncharacterized membrane protein YfcA
MILFTSFTATSSYFAFGLLIPNYAAACAVLGFVATSAGQVGLAIVISRTGNRYSYIAYSVGIVVVLSAIFMTAQFLLTSMDHDGPQQLNGGICSVGE